MKVYLVVHEVHYEGATIIGVCATKERADKMALKYIDDSGYLISEFKKTWNNCYHGIPKGIYSDSEINITEFEVWE